MAFKSQRWHINPPLPQSQVAQFQYFHPVLAQILYNRGYTDATTARAFLEGGTPLGEPTKMLGMGAALARIRRAIDKRESIVVYGDFDADGVTSTALLMIVLRALGANAHPYIPHRVDEGYGLNEAALCKLAQKGVKLVITVDCGIRSLYEVEVGKQAGLDIIITDHHSVGPEVPQAYAVINPKQPNCRYPEKMLAGVGVTFKLADALLRANAQQGKRQVALQAEDLLDLVAIGTIADLVPMSHPENRALVLRGLEQLRRAHRPGIRALLEVAGLSPDLVNATSIGFVIGPRLNAAGRLDSAMTAYELLATDDLQVAADCAQKLQALNVERQRLTREAQDYALAGLDLTTRDNIPLIFAIDAGFKQGIVGLVAGRLTEEFYRPAIVMHRGKDESHGSCRSIVEFNITEALDQCADLLLRHGGHVQAAGFAIANDNLPSFHERIMDIATAELRNKDLRPRLDIDADLPFSQLNTALYEALVTLQPCGHDHPAPILCSRGLRVTECRTVGKDNAHLKLKLADGVDEMEAIGFRMGELNEELPSRVDVAYELDLNEWNGSQRLQLKLEDIREATR